jgi:hypothetical protein
VKYKIYKVIGMIIASFITGFFASWYIFGDTNTKPVYGKTGLPKNCRAIIMENINAFENNTFPADEVIASIDRNCGAQGHSWGR